MTVYECLMPHCAGEVYRRHDVCDPCWEDRKPQLDAIPELYVMTYALLTPGSRIQEIGTIHMDKPASSVPFSMVAFDALEYAQGRIAAWAEWLSSTGGYGQRLRSLASDGSRFKLDVQYLLDCDGRLGRTDFAGDYVLDVWTVYRRLVMQCLPTAPRHLSVSCPVCQYATVITRHADEFATCLTCRTIWPHSQLPIATKMAART